MSETISVLTYDLSWYEQYQELQGVDRTKKALEHSALTRALHGYGLTAPGRMLDIGTATARYLIIFARQGWRTTGVDSSPAAISAARREIERAGLTQSIVTVQSDVRELELGAERFDLITCMMGTFSHIPESDRLSVLERLRGYLAPGGVLALSNWNPAWPNPTTLTLYPKPVSDKIVELSPDSQEVTSLIRSAGFCDVKLIDVCPFNDEQIRHWMVWEERTPHLLQRYVLDQGIVVPGQLTLATGINPGV